MGDDISWGLSSVAICFDFRSTNIVQLSNQNPYLYWFPCHHPLITQLNSLVLSYLFMGESSTILFSLHVNHFLKFTLNVTFIPPYTFIRQLKSIRRKIRIFRAATKWLLFGRQNTVRNGLKRTYDLFLPQDWHPDGIPREKWEKSITVCLHSDEKLRIPIENCISSARLFVIYRHSGIFCFVLELTYLEFSKIKCRWTNGQMLMKICYYTTSWGCWKHPFGIPGVRPMF